MKKYSPILLVLFLSFAPFALAQSTFIPLAPIPGLTGPGTTSAVDSETLANFFNNLYKFAIGLAAVLAIIEIIWGGLEIAVNKENVGKMTEARGRIVQALLGLVLVLSPVLVFSVINPSILNLSLGLPELKTMPGTGTSIPAGSTPSTQTPPSSSTLIPGTGSTCTGYSSFRSADITPPKYCVDQFGGGWVNLDAICCAGQTAPSAGTNVQCCGLNASYTAPAATTPATPIPGGETSYTDAKQIPAGSWCYKANSYGAITTTTTFVCAANKNDCIALTQSETNTVISGCTQY